MFLKEIREGATLRSKNKARKYAIKQYYKSCKWTLKNNYQLNIFVMHLWVQIYGKIT